MKGIVISAGYGSRFFPITKIVPKELLPLWTEPIISFSIDEIQKAGIKDVLVITSRRKRAIEDFFDRDVELEWFYEGKEDKRELLNPPNINVFYVRQRYMKGVGDALLLARPFVGSDDFVVIYPDDVVIDSGESLKKMIRVSREKSADVVLAVVKREREEVERYGVVEIGEVLEEGVFQIERVVEKPDVDSAPSQYTIIGRYVYTPNLFRLLEEHYKSHKKGEFHQTSALNEMAKSGKVFAVEISPDVIFDTGEPFSYIVSQVRYSLMKGGDAFRKKLMEVIENASG